MLKILFCFRFMEAPSTEKKNHKRGMKKSDELGGFSTFTGWDDSTFVPGSFKQCALKFESSIQ